MKHRATESGLRLLMTTHRKLLRDMSVPATRRPIGRIPLSGGGDGGQVLLQGTFLRMVSVVEATVDTLAKELTEVQLSSSITEEIRLLALEKELSGSSNWHSRHKIYRRHHGLNLAKLKSAKSLDGAIEVRNAIAHGLGYLTTRQIHSQETPKNLRAIGISSIDGFLRLRAADLSSLANYAGEFLRDLDSVAP